MECAQALQKQPPNKRSRTGLQRAQHAFACQVSGALFARKVVQVSTHRPGPVPFVGGLVAATSTLARAIATKRRAWNTLTLTLGSRALVMHAGIKGNALRKRAKITATMMGNVSAMLTLILRFATAKVNGEAIAAPNAHAFMASAIPSPAIATASKAGLASSATWNVHLRVCATTMVRALKP